MVLVKQKAVRPIKAGVGEQPRDCNEILADIEDADAAVRRHAAREIAGYPDAATALVSRLKRENEIAVREVILNALIRLNDPSVASRLAGCLRSDDAALRNDVIQAMKRLDSKVEPILCSLLADPDPDVRIFAVNILDSERHPEIESLLIKIIEQDAHVNVCATALDLLCEVGTAAAVDPIIRLKSRLASEPYIQFAADLALKRIGEV